MLYIVGFGAGGSSGMTVEAKDVLAQCDLIVGYTVYVELLQPVFPEKTFLSTPMRREQERVQLALEKAAEGLEVALVCSGDSGVYGMAGLALTLGQAVPQVEIRVVAGVTAALSGGAVLGAPLTHDFCVVSLSDLLTPWEKISRRLAAAAAADFVIVLYNPSSKKRADHLQKACRILLQYKAEDTVCGYVQHIGREGECSRLLTLAQLCDTQVDMFTTVFIGNSETKQIGGKMVTPRGYDITKQR